MYNIHPPSFAGKHNEVRARCYLVLYNLKDELLTARELALLANCKATVVAAALPDWYRWHFVRRYKVQRPTRRMYTYSATERLKKWVETWSPWMDKAGKLQGWKAEIAENIRLYRDNGTNPVNSH
jgi:hypothetical protein